MKNLTFSIKGMHCESCAQAIKRIVERQPGVRAASVSFADSEARLLIDPSAADEAHLAAAIEKPGYRVVGRRASAAH